MIDGASSGAGWVLRGDKKAGAVGCDRGVQMSGSTVKLFTFSKLQLTRKCKHWIITGYFLKSLYPRIADESAPITAGPSLGTISLFIKKVIVTKDRMRYSGRPVELDSHGPVYEKSAKAGNHVVSLVPRLSCNSIYSLGGFFQPWSSREATTTGDELPVEALLAR